MSVFRPSARTSSPDGRQWEIYVYKLQFTSRRTPDPTPLDFGPGCRAETVSGLLDGIVYLLAWIPRLLLRVVFDMPIAVARALTSDEWIVEAVSWAPFQARYRWSTTTTFRGQVAAHVEGGLSRGDIPRPRNARLLAIED